jgi:Tfp pilus assembly protein PilE
MVVAVERAILGMTLAELAVLVAAVDVLEALALQALAIHQLPHHHKETMAALEIARQPEVVVELQL